MFKKTENPMPHLTRLFAATLLWAFCQLSVSAQTGGKQVSLKKYAPAFRNAGKITEGESFSWATAYYAPAITFRLAKEELFSPYYLFDALPKTKAGCQLPENYISQAQQILRDGYFRDSDYKRTGNCAVKPDLGKYKNMDRYRIHLSIVLKARPHARSSPSEVWFSVRRRLDAGVPVIATLDADEAFRNLKTGRWRPAAGAKTFKHSVVITGYDEVRKEVEILSPFGRSWGNQGFGRIGFDQLGACSELYAVSKPVDYLIQNKIPATVPRHPISGMLQLRTFWTKNANEEPVFDNLDYVLVNGIFEAKDRKPLPASKQFQVVVDGVVPGGFLYAFSIGPDGKTIIHRPQNGTLDNIKIHAFPARIAGSEKQIILPRSTSFGSKWNHRGFHKTQAGADWLVVLHSSREISNQRLLNLAHTIKAGQDAPTLTDQLRKTLGSRLMTQFVTKSSSGTLTYSATGGSGDILPLIIRIF